MNNITPILEKYDNFRGAQMRSVKNLTTSSKLVTIVLQDEDGEDESSVELEFKDIKESQILEDGVLSYLDMSSGITLLKEHNLYGFALGHGTAMLHVHNAPLFIVASSVEIREL